MSYITGRRQYSPICNIEEGDDSSLKLKLDDGVSPMTYKKLKEMGYTSDDWQNWSDDEKVEKSQSGKENKQPAKSATSTSQSTSGIETRLTSKASELSKQIQQLKRERKEVGEKYNNDHKHPEVAKLDKKWQDLTSKYYSTVDALKNIKREKESVEEPIEQLTTEGGRETIKNAYKSLRSALKFVSVNSDEYKSIEEAQDALLDARNALKRSDNSSNDLSETYQSLIDARDAIKDISKSQNNDLIKAVAPSKNAIDKLIKQIEQYSR